MIATEIRAEVHARLRQAERDHEVRVLLAVESGSRAWGFASANSDYDARFIYVHKPSWYMAVDYEDQRDVIEYPIVDDMDINGWDLRKALRLFWKSNPGFVEWIQSPIVYEHFGTFHVKTKELLPAVYSASSGIYHYRSSAKATYKTHLQAQHVSLKKYFYALRPILAANWIERFGTPAPIEFSKLLESYALRSELRAEIESLLEMKRAAPELGKSARIPVLDAFIEAELARLDALAPKNIKQPNAADVLSQLFHTTIADAWNETHCLPQ